VSRHLTFKYNSKTERAHFCEVYKSIKTKAISCRIISNSVFLMNEKGPILTDLSELSAGHLVHIVGIVLKLFIPNMFYLSSGLGSKWQTNA